MAGLDNLKGLFQPGWFYDSMKSTVEKHINLVYFLTDYMCAYIFSQTVNCICFGDTRDTKENCSTSCTGNLINVSGNSLLADPWYMCNSSG